MSSRSSQYSNQSSSNSTNSKIHKVTNKKSFKRESILNSKKHDISQIINILQINPK